MNAQDLREKSVADLKDQLISLREDQFKLTMQQSTGQLGQTHLLKENRRDVARIKTIIAEKVGTE